VKALMDETRGSVFTAIGSGQLEAASLEIRAGLMLELRELIRDRRLSQSSAATLFGVSQPRVSDLVRGKIDLFRIDTLVRMLMRTGAQVAVTVRRPGRAA
jgi:predicted XRE-type DNA-binding protein